MIVQFNGPVTEEHARAAVDIYREIGSKRPFFMLADVSHSSIETGARNLLSKHARPEWYRGVVYVGAPLVLRTVTKALNLMVLFNGKNDYETMFAGSVEEGRALLEQMRARLGSRSSAAKGA